MTLGIPLYIHAIQLSKNSNINIQHKYIIYRNDFSPNLTCWNNEA